MSTTAPSGEPGIIAPGKPLISESYRLEQKKLHDTGKYGTMGAQYAPFITKVIDRLQVDHLLDYGCGSNIGLYKNIAPNHKVTYQAYDPCVEEYSDPPVPAQMVCCIDVLEHIEPELLDNVLDDLQRLTEVLIFCTIFTGPAQKLLSDGRNAHLTQEPMEWWLQKLWSRFDLHTVQQTNENAFYVIAYAKPRFLENMAGEKIAGTTEVS